MHPNSFRQVILATLLFGLSAQTPADESGEVLAAWESYRSAILAQDADAAWALIDRTTRSYYHELLQAVIYARPQDMPQLMIMVKLAVIQSRRDIPAGRLVEFDAGDYFRHSVAHGWFSKDTMRQITLVAIEVDGDNARSSVERDGQVVSSGYEFRRENGTWKVNLMPALIAGEWAMQQIVAASGKAEDEFIFDLVEAHSGARPDASIWEPIVDR